MSGTAKAALPPMRTALRKLCLHGEEALKPQFVNNQWRSSMLSKRVAAKVRKQAILDSTYGTFDATTGRGWDASWDKPGKIASIRPFKETKRERTREVRATKIEGLMEQMEQKIENYRSEIEAKKPIKNMEYKYKLAMKGGAKK
mmetsp:Transcript_7152/g.12831  ORF Transcript_7152/g.12831 Transcript_7152/m.12831 type:complete len:144 (-) Transcript_7152:136-567(-)|eukprot:CAMPEP_0198293232 /NCGR_PEP_ID=MMETSP1449-20131203/16062_1 /TAXON_ID=420275 /ORGANISM="Attheya septentrionalis, Strain CCMP2084" /LENGTH=143 /DNA_ID=CAMNT_0043992745 /DNA_START=194 /DNA_END=625 /DNA_ORIENTATION=+